MDSQCSSRIMACSPVRGPILILKHGMCYDSAANMRLILWNLRGTISCPEPDNLSSQHQQRMAHICFVPVCSYFTCNLPNELLQDSVALIFKCINLTVLLWQYKEWISVLLFLFISQFLHLSYKTLKLSLNPKVIYKHTLGIMKYS